MKSLGIIAEFNPFHQGHKYLIDKSMRETQSEVCIAVMSGSFVQRGMPAVYDKWTRAQEAIKGGVNLVIELPVIYVCSNAEHFAEGGVAILEGLGCDKIAFGSESGDLQALQRAANFLIQEKKLLHEGIRELTKKGISYPKARQKIIEKIAPDFDLSLISEPNNTLAIEYLQKITSMEGYTVSRSGESYHQSASRIRAELEAEAPELFRQAQKNYYHMLCAEILRSNSQKLESIFSAGEGIGNKIKKEIRYANSLEELAARVKSKAYTHSRISRLFAQILLDIEKDSVSGQPPYARVLAFDEKGSSFLREKKKDGCKIPILTNINKEVGKLSFDKSVLDKDILATDLRNLIYGKGLYENSDYIMRPKVTSHGRKGIHTFR